MPSVCNELRAWRQRGRLTQLQAAVALGVPLGTLQNWEQARAVPRGLALESLREKLNEPPP